MKRMKEKDWAVAFKGIVLRIDARALIALVSAFGLLSWFGPWPLLCVFLPLALASFCAAYALMPGGRGFLRAYLLFVFFWLLSFFFLQLWEHAGENGIALAALGDSLIFGARLFSMLSLALLLPLCISAVTLGRALTWYIQRLGLCCRGKTRERVMQAGWKAGLALTLMAAFMPRVFRTLKAQAQSIKLRAPQLPLHRRLWLLGLASLRLMGTQSWDMSVSIAARGLYREEPWLWRKSVGR